MTPANPAAFPNSYFNNVHGMTLRDWFAGHVIQWALSDPLALRMVSESLGVTDAEAAARSCYEIADALLAQREKPNG